MQNYVKKQNDGTDVDHTHFYSREQKKEAIRQKNEEELNQDILASFQTQSWDDVWYDIELEVVEAASVRAECLAKMKTLSKDIHPQAHNDTIQTHSSHPETTSFFNTLSQYAHLLIPNVPFTKGKDGNDTIYGQMEGGKLHGLGQKVSSCGSCCYEGYWKNGQMHGYVRSVTSGGEMRTSQYKNGYRHGKWT